MSYFGVGSGVGSGFGTGSVSGSVSGSEFGFCSCLLYDKSLYCPSINIFVFLINI